MTERQQWTWTYRLALAKALLVNGDQGVHADDVDVDLPAHHRNLVGQTFKRFLEKGWMSDTKERRASRRRSTHGRKSNIYRVTETGRAVFAGRGGSRVVAAPLTPSSGDPSPAQQASRGATPAPRPLPVSRLPRTSDPAVRARREDAVVKAFEDFEAVTVGAEWLPTQDTLEIAA